MFLPQPRNREARQAHLRVGELLQHLSSFSVGSVMRSNDQPSCQSSKPPCFRRLNQGELLHFSPTTKSLCILKTSFNHQAADIFLPLLPLCWLFLWQCVSAPAHSPSVMDGPAELRAAETDELSTVFLAGALLDTAAGLAQAYFGRASSCAA